MSQRTELAAGDGEGGRRHKSGRSIETLLSEGSIEGGRRSRKTARLYLDDLKAELGLVRGATADDRALEDFIVEAVLGAGWYQAKLRSARRRIGWYIALNVALVIALPIGVALMGMIPGMTQTSAAASQLTAVLTGVLGLQKTLSSWYASQQRYAAWYKSAADLKSIYYGLVQRWNGCATAQPAEFASALADATSAARQTITDEELDFYQKLALPSFDILDLLTSSRSTVASFVSSLLPGAPPTSVTIAGRAALVGAPAEAPPGTGPSSVPLAPALAPGVQVRAPGAQKPNNNPYTIVIIANPALEQGIGTLSFQPDPILGMADRFEGAVQYVLASLFGRLPGQAENFLAPFEPSIRILSIFDPALAPGDNSSLVAEDMNSDSLVPRQPSGQAILANFMDQGRPVVADVVIAVTASATHTRCSSYYTYDNPDSDGVDFTFNQNAWRHRYKNKQPGITALHVTADSVTALHEFSHAASSWDNGAVLDLYKDIAPKPAPINLAIGRPIPPIFGTYEAIDFSSAPNRGGLPYPPGWQDYHCALVAPSYPALMDDYRLAAGGHSERCRHDQITVRFLTDRIRALSERP